MSKTVTIPTDGGNPFVVILGGIKYVYKPGDTVDVPDGVALEIEEWERWHKKYYGDNVPPFGAGGGAQPDWNQNDPNAPDYVKNRTHYEEFKTIIEEREVRSWLDARWFAASRIPQVGEKLTVTFNGETYKCVAWESNGDVGLGNGKAYSINKGENVPFFVGFEENDERARVFIATAITGENIISIVDDSGNTLFEETFNIEINVDEPCYSQSIPLDQPLIVGNTYKVVYDGVPYECVAWEDDDSVFLGNGEIDGYEHSEDAPFVIGTFLVDSGWLLWIAYYGTDSHTISVSEAVVKKLDPRYLPDAADTADYQERTHWDTRETKEVTFFEETIEMNFSNTTYPCEQEIHSGDTVNLYIDGELKHSVTKSGNVSVTSINPSPDFQINIYNTDHEMIIYNGQYSGLCRLDVVTEIGELKQLDEKYIPVKNSITVITIDGNYASMGYNEIMERVNKGEVVIVHMGSDLFFYCGDNNEAKHAYFSQLSAHTRKVNYCRIYQDAAWDINSFTLTTT